MNRKILLPLLALGLVGGLLYYLQYAGRQTADGMTLYGNVDIREVNLAFRVGGRLQEMLLDEGDAVQAGDELARLDAQPYTQAVDVALAAVAQAQATLDKLQAGSRPEEIRRSEARVAEAEAESSNALTEVNRLKDLIIDGATSQQQLDNALARHQVALARLRSTQEDLALLEAGFRDEDIAAAAAQLAAARANAAEARTRLDDTRLLAPSAGTLISRVREPGSVVAAGETVYTLSLHEPVWVRAYVDEPLLGRVKSGMAVRVTSDSTDQSFTGQIGFISPRAEFTPRTVETEALRTDLVYRVRIVVTDTDGQLRQGMPVTIELAEGGQ